MKTLFFKIVNARLFLLVVTLFFSSVLVKSQNYFRSGIFLHHSTGQNIWGPNGSSTSVPQEMGTYNTVHGYTGLQAVTMDEEWWSPPDNEWVTQHAFFENPDPITGIGYYLPGNKIIVIKSCFPSSAMTGAGMLSDTLTPDLKTVMNYKWHWRHIVNVMKSHPGNFFVIWTNAPLEPNSTNTSEAAFSNWFCTWAKDTLAMGLDPVSGVFPDNVYVFDFFHKLTDANGMMLEYYATGPGDSHPNSAATELVAPQFVQEIFNASIGYESVFGIISSTTDTDSRISASPNPFREKTFVTFTLRHDQPAELALFDLAGKKVCSLWKGNRKGNYQIVLSGNNFSAGTYCLRLSGSSGKYYSLLVTQYY